MNPYFENVVGLDLSMSSTGLAVYQIHHSDSPAYDPRDPLLFTLARVKSRPEDWRSGPVGKNGKMTETYRDRYLRMENIADRIALNVPEGSLVVMEGPSYGSKGSGTWDRAGLWWLVYDALSIHRKCRIVVGAPTQRMQYATGTGRADKDTVLAAVVKRYHWLDISGNDVADAVVFMAMAARLAGVQFDALPKANLKAMDKLDLTDMERD